MRRLTRYSVIMPVTQFALALVLWKWPYQYPRVDTLYMPTSQLIAYGVNAPALLVNIIRPLYDKLDQVTPTVWGFTVHEAAFLIGVIALWYLIGRTLDRYLVGEAPAKRLTIGAIIRYACMTILGILFLAGGIDGLRTPGQWNNYVGNDIVSTLAAFWGLALILIPAFKFVSAIRRKLAKPSQGPKPILSYR